MGNHIHHVHIFASDLDHGYEPKANFEKIPQQTAEDHTLRFAGLFNLPIPMRFALGIGVSQ